MFDSLIEFLKGLVSDVMDWVLGLFEWAFLSLWKLLLEGLATVLEAIPVPGFMNDAQSFFGNIPPSIVYFFHYFAIAEGIAFFSAALLLRFITRRIPIIG